MAPWPHQPCPHPQCNRWITDLLAEMVPDADRFKSEFKAILGQHPGGAITCPYCQGAVEYAEDGNTLVVSAQTPLRFSRTKMDARALDYGSQKNPPAPGMTPEEWIAEEKIMAGALHDYVYAEDFVP